METTAHTEPAILVVEDDGVLRRVMAELLTLYGCRVDVASDAYRAAALLDRRCYDVVLSDIQLPGHGLSTLDHAHRSQPETPVILITSLRRPALRRRAFASGAFDVLEKPLTGAELRAVVERALHSGGDGNRSSSNGSGNGGNGHLSARPGGNGVRSARPGTGGGRQRQAVAAAGGLRGNAA